MNIKKKKEFAGGKAISIWPDVRIFLHHARAKREKSAAKGGKTPHVLNGGKNIQAIPWHFSAITGNSQIVANV